MVSSQNFDPSLPFSRYGIAKGRGGRNFFSWSESGVG